jgi:hypothetical protein
VTQNNKGALGEWVNTQRKSFRKGKMHPERKRMLNEIGLDFNANDKANERKWMGLTFEKKWNLQFKKLQDYYEKHGHCELFWDDDRFTFILNTPTNTPSVSLHALKAMSHGSTRNPLNWADGSNISGQASDKA